MEPRVNPHTNLQQLFADWPELVPFFLKKRLACAGCAMARFETLGDLERSYALDPERLIMEIEDLLTRKRGG